MSDYPRTIDNSAGEELTFLRRGSGERGEYLEARNTVKPGSGPPMHVHRLQEESLTVERGTMGWQRHFDASGRRKAPAPVRRRLPPVALRLRVRDGGHPGSRAALRVPGR